MSTTYPVRWQKLFRSLTVFMSIGIALPISFAVVMRLIQHGYEKAFEHISPLSLFLIYLGIPVVSALFALPIAYWFKLASIKLSDHEISGRNYWGIRRSIPLKSIKQLSPFSNNGINAIVVDGGTSGKIYIHEYTECYSELIELLSTYISNEKENGT